MKYPAYVIAIMALVGAATGSAQTPSTSAPIFRRVMFPPLAPITLGQPIPLGAPRTVPVAPGRRAVTGQTLGDADSIFVETTPGDTVTRLEFRYPLDKDVDAAVGQYQDMLGSATHAGSDSASGHLDRWTWRDGATKFQFTSFRVGATVQRVWATLSDSQPSSTTPPNER